MAQCLTLCIAIESSINTQRLKGVYPSPISRGDVEPEKSANKISVCSKNRLENEKFDSVDKCKNVAYPQLVKRAKHTPEKTDGPIAIATKQRRMSSASALVGAQVLFQMYQCKNIVSFSNNHDAGILLPAAQLCVCTHLSTLQHCIRHHVGTL